MNYKYRCGRDACRRIYTLSKPLSHYVREKKCSCGGNLHDYSCDRKRNKARTCHCDGVHYPHKKGPAFGVINTRLDPLKLITKYGTVTEVDSYCDT